MPLDPIRLQHPIVLIHGLGARSTYGPFEYFWGLPARLRAAGNRVYVANLTAWQTIENRSEQLKKQILENFPEGKVNLIGHSMGGLDARYVTSALGLGAAQRVASVTTVGTPNRGSVVGDIATGMLPDSGFVAVDRLLKLLDSSAMGMRQVTSRYCIETLNPAAPDIPGVQYFSASSAITDPIVRSALPLFWVPYVVLKGYEGDNDGFVSVHSAQWGNYICTYPGDHYGQIGQFLGRSRGLDYVKFWDEIFGALHKAGV
jgi:triacylglycerol lipase